jgi:hypothetical protein
MSQRARDALAKATPQNHSKAKKADAPKNSREERFAERNASKTANASRDQSDGSADDGRPAPRKRSRPSTSLAESEDDEMESSGAIASEVAGGRKLKKHTNVKVSAPATQVVTEFMVSFEWIAVL